MRKVLSVKKSQFHNIDDGSDITKFHGLKARIRYRQALQSVQIKRKKSKYFFILIVPKIHYKWSICCCV